MDNCMVMKWSLVVGSFGKAVGHLYGHQGSILGVCSQEEVPCHLSLLFKKKRKNSNDKMYNYCNKNIFLERRYDHVKVDLQCLHGLQIFFLMFRITSTQKQNMNYTLQLLLIGPSLSTYGRKALSQIATKQQI